MLIDVLFSFLFNRMICRYNRLKSIEEDASFVTEISTLFPQYAIVGMIV